MREDKKKIREARKLAHKVFDRLWKTKAERTEAYAWLASEMGMSENDCHIGNFSAEQCYYVVDLVRARGKVPDVSRN